MRLGFGHESEQKAGRSIDVGPNLELIWVVVHDDPAQRGAPPTSEVGRRGRVDDHLLPREAHPISLPLHCERCRWRHPRSAYEAGALVRPEKTSVCFTGSKPTLR